MRLRDTIAAYGTSEGVRKAWESREHAKPVDARDVNLRDLDEFGRVRLGDNGGPKDKRQAEHMLNSYRDHLVDMGRKGFNRKADIYDFIDYMKSNYRADMHSKDYDKTTQMAVDLFKGAKK